jgi:hypothetical protein
MRQSVYLPKSTNPEIRPAVPSSLFTDITANSLFSCKILALPQQKQLGMVSFFWCG